VGLEHVDEVTLSNHEDGVALVLNRLVPRRPLRLGFLASHGGSSMTAILDAIRRGQLDASAQVVISNNSRSAALATARGAGIPSYHLSEMTVGGHDDLDVAIRDALVRHDVTLVILSGYMKKIGPKTLDAFRSRILNVHPALLPNYGGHGMYGRNVHAAVLEAGETETGGTIHLVDEEYDHGRIIGQAAVPVLKTDTVDNLAARVLEREKSFFVEVLQRIAESGPDLL
jgi:phosphoribosylglycinamide formyltransferase 1